MHASIAPRRVPPAVSTGSNTGPPSSPTSARTRQLAHLSAIGARRPGAGAGAAALLVQAVNGSPASVGFDVTGLLRAETLEFVRQAVVRRRHPHPTLGSASRPPGTSLARCPAPRPLYQPTGDCSRRGGACSARKRAARSQAGRCSMCRGQPSRCDGEALVGERVV